MQSLKPIQLLQKTMHREQIDYYLIYTSDYHQSEYVCAFFKERAYISGFTGSAGTLLVSQNDAWLWTDGRYFIQAERELKAASGANLMKMGEEGVPTIEEFLNIHLKEGQVLAVDGRTISMDVGKKLRETCGKANGELRSDCTLVHQIWSDRPSLPKDELFVLEECYAGKSVTDKLTQVREEMTKVEADGHLLTSLDDIAWLLNLRGYDVANTPIFLSYVYITADRCVLFVDKDKLNEQVTAYLCENQIQVQDYFAITDYLKACSEKKVLIDAGRVNDTLYQILAAKMEIISRKNPTELLKAVKNPTEIACAKLAHLKDGVACTEFMHWLKHLDFTKGIDEWDAAAMMDALRAKQEHYVMPSFETISAYNANAAMMHYSAKKETAAVLKPQGMLLVDSGGQYFEGTTDITRTYGLGETTADMKKHFTYTLKGMLRLANAKFLYGCTGTNLDVLARQPLWSIGIDYKCGTGHGIGFLLSVHEGPNSFRWKPLRDESVVLEAGMITTDEPGVYLEGQYGIRIENELLCVKAEKNDSGQFMKFDTLTIAPIDLELVDVTLLDASEKEMLNEYHAFVREQLMPRLDESLHQWFEHVTRAI